MTNMIGESGYSRVPLDAYWTIQPWVTDWFMLESGIGTACHDKVIWEPACGAGHLSDVLKQHHPDVLSTDVKDYGYKYFDGEIDFMFVESIAPNIKAIITNPPYDVMDEGYTPVTADEFLRHALKLMKPNKGIVAMLLRNEYDSGNTRLDITKNPTFFGKYVLTSRPSWGNIKPPDPKKKKAGPRHNYSWFVWNFNEEHTASVIKYLHGKKAS